MPRSARSATHCARSTTPTRSRRSSEPREVLMSSLLRASRDLLAYTVWADRIQLGALEQVELDDFERETGSSHRSLRGTMAHMLGAQRLWLSRFLGNPLPVMPGEDDYPSLAALP